MPSPSVSWRGSAASAAHLYGSRLVNAEAFTCLGPHWEEDPYQLKPLADTPVLRRCQSPLLPHLHPLARRGRQARLRVLRRNPFQSADHLVGAGRGLDAYIARAAFLLQQGRFVADVCYYYGDQVPNNVQRKPPDPSLGPGYDYDVVNGEVARVANIGSRRADRVPRRHELPHPGLAGPRDHRPGCAAEGRRAGQRRGHRRGAETFRATGLRDYPRCDRAVEKLGRRPVGSLRRQDGLPAPLWSRGGWSAASRPASSCGWRA